MPQPEVLRAGVCKYSSLLDATAYRQWSRQIKHIEIQPPHLVGVEVTLGAFCLFVFAYALHGCILCRAL